MRTWVDCKGLKLLSLTKMSDRWPSANFGPKVIPSILSKINSRLLKSNSNSFFTGEIWVNWLFKLLIFWILSAFDKSTLNSLITFPVSREKDLSRLKRWVSSKAIISARPLVSKSPKLLLLVEPKFPKS